VVEDAPAEELFNRPLHPYTRGLLASVPFPGRKSVLGKKGLVEIPGIVPSMFDIPNGCVFNPRCTLAREGCRARPPQLIEQGKDHHVACWAVEEGW
jgi:oligopeptide/dipeptide ABC transporter ATP-binding protein